MSPTWEEGLNRDRVYKATSALCQYVREQKEKSKNILEDDAEWIFLVSLDLTARADVCPSLCVTSRFRPHFESSPFSCNLLGLPLASYLLLASQETVQVLLERGGFPDLSHHARQECRLDRHSR